MRWLIGAVWLVLALDVPACTKANPAFCCTSPVDCANEGLMGTNTADCADGFVCIAHGCTTPPPVDAAPDAPPECAVNHDCPAAKPFCTPAMTCVECLTSDECPAATPTCDATTSSCRACETNEDCASSVCDVETGMCTAAADVVYASPTGTGACTQLDPCSITQAFAVANAARNTVKLAPGAYTASLVVNGETVIVEGTGATVTESGDTETFTVNDNAELRMHGLTVVNDDSTTPGHGVNCKSTNGTLRPALKLVGVTIDALGGSVSADGCDATITESQLHVRNFSENIVYATAGSIVTSDRTVFDGGDGLVALTGFIHVTNSVISNQAGPDGAFFGGGGGSVTVSFSTIVNSLVGCATSGTAACTGAGSSQNGVCFDNSIILNTTAGAPANTVTGVACSFAFTEVFPQSAALPHSGAGNKIGVDPQLADPANGDFHLKSTSPAIDAANPTATDAIDLDGTIRPQGLHDDLGAFEFH